MGYSENDSMVRVDFFKPSGKWYATEAVEWTGAWDGHLYDIHAAFEKSLVDHFTKTGNVNRFSSMDAICLEPYHIYSHPIMIKNGEWLK